MPDWEIVQCDDEKLPRAITEYEDFHCICEPDEKHDGKYGYAVFGSQGDWQSDNYRSVILYEYWSDPSFKGLTTIAEAQKACIETVDRYRSGQLKPIFKERGKSADRETNAAGVKLRRVKSPKRKKT